MTKENIKICPIIEKECILEKCVAHRIRSYSICSIGESKQPNWKECPLNDGITIFGYKILNHKFNAAPYFYGLNKDCYGCKYRKNCIEHLCGAMDNKIIKREIIE